MGIRFAGEGISLANPGISVGEVLVKSLLLCLLAGVASRLLRRAAASLRHTLWLGTLLGLLLLPWMQQTLPSWQAINLPALSVAKPHSAAPVIALSVPAASPPVPSAVSIPSHFEYPFNAREQARIQSASIPHAEEWPEERHGMATSSAPIVPVHPHRQMPWLQRQWLLRVCFLLWLTGCAALLSQILFGLCRIVGLSRHSLPVTDPEILTLLQNVRQEPHLSASSLRNRPVTLQISTELNTPITFGFRRIQVVLPAEAIDWSSERMRAVLLHELGHSVRRDWLLQMLANVCCAVYWFHPLVWLAARQMRMESERACDDLVLLAGVRASDYAALLLEMARRREGRKVGCHGAVSMAQPALIEKRLRSILDSRQHRKGLPRVLRIVGLAMGSSLLVVLASAQVGSKPATELPAVRTTVFDVNNAVVSTALRNLQDPMPVQVMQTTLGTIPISGSSSANTLRIAPLQFDRE